MPLAVAAPPSEPPAQVAEVVVTAQKRDATLLETPLAVTVVSGEALRRSGGRDVKDLQFLTPGLILTSTANETQTTARLRGVGTVGDNPGLESSVGVVIDGVSRPRTGTAVQDLGEIDRIEVLKGPQGTLFGQNASAGVIQVLTAAPTFEDFVAAEATVGDRGARGGSVTLNAGLSDTVAGRLHLSRRKRDGLYDVRLGSGPRTEREDNEQNYYTLRGQLLFEPDADTRVRAIVDFARREEHCCVGVQLTRGATAGWIDALAPDEGVAAAPDPEGRVAWSNRSTAQTIEDGGLSVQGDFGIGGVRLTSLTAARRWRSINGYDADFSTADIYYRDPDGSFGSEFVTFSQELRLAGGTDRLRWLVGGYLSAETLERRDQYLYGRDYESYAGLLLSGGANAGLVSTITGLTPGASFRAGEGARDLYHQRTRTAALFTENNWRASDRLTLTGGLRLTVQEKDLASTYTTTDGGPACAAARARGSTAVSVLCLPWSNGAFAGVTRQSRSDSNASGTLKASWRWSDAAVSYASWTRGWKAGGFNLDREQAAFAPDADTAFAAETVENWELGTKARAFDGALAVDLAVFHEAFEDFQLNAFSNATFLVTSVPELTSSGAEAEVRWRTPAAGLTVSAGATYAETEFGSTPVASLPRLTDARAAFAPLWSGVLAADWERRVGTGFRLGARLSAKLNSTYNTGSDLNPLKVQPGYGVVDGRVWLGAEDEDWTLELWGRNLGDHLYRQVAFDAPLQSGTVNAFLGEPRTLGATLRLRR